MKLVKLGSKGQVSIPRAFLRQLGINTSGYFLAEVKDGVLQLTPATVKPTSQTSGKANIEIEGESS
jgi:bifunctional DNA-binding transcriptional regulator/antitoxin component of YhaV-PrlF toxin-antitoxin module